MFSMDDCIQEILLVKKLSFEIISKQNLENIDQIYSILISDETKTAEIVKNTKLELLGVFVMIARNNNEKPKEDRKIHMLEIVSLTLSHIKLNHNESLFFLNLFGTFIQEVYEIENCTLKHTSEEHMWQVLCCIRLLFDSITDELCLFLYTKENSMRMCKVIYIVGKVLKSRSRNLKLEAIKCLMSVFRVSPSLDLEDLFCDIIVAETVADCFSYFLPGIALSLGSIILEGERVGQIILQLTTEAIGKIMTILLKNYKNRSDSLEDAKAMVLSRLKSSSEIKKEPSKNKKEDFLNMKRTQEWFKTSDQHLAPIFTKFKYLTQHYSDEVRLNLAKMCCSLIEHCYENIPQSSYQLIEMLILMLDDENEEVSFLCMDMFDVPILEQQITNILSDRFYENFSKIPSVFNGLDAKEQINILKLTSASIKLVGNKIKCNSSFKEFQRTLLYLCEVEIDTSSFAEVISHEDLDGDQPISASLWKNFKFMKEENVRKQFCELCKIIYEAGLYPVLSDYLINIVAFGDEKVEAFYLLNQLLEGINMVNSESEEGLLDLIKPTFQIYIDNWDIPLTIDEDECTSLKTLRMNILTAGLLCEGVGLMACHAKGEQQFRPFLFNSLYKVLIRAASTHYQIQAAATTALRKMATGLGYHNVTELLNDNMDFFLFNIERGLKKTDHKGEVFEVMEMVMKYGDVSILRHFSDFVYDVLVQSFDRFKQNRIDSYLRVFRIFLRSLLRWFEVEVPARVFLTKEELREEELRNFKVGGLEDDPEKRNDFSDEVMGKSAEEMYREDMERREGGLEDDYLEPKVEAYEKPKLPLHVKITVEILKRSLNFLPSKDTNRKLLVLELLRNGVEIIRDFEDELLPIVHLIWSPLVDRFKEVDSPVILNNSFQLLVVLGRLSKDFIRNRTAKDVLPSILSILSTFSEKSYLKDRGSSYRYTLDYKLQLLILENLVYLVTDVQLLEKDIESAMDVVLLYLSDKQPMPLQVEAVKFLDLITRYDPIFEGKINKWSLKTEKQYEKNLNLILNKERCE